MTLRDAVIGIDFGSFASAAAISKDAAKITVDVIEYTTGDAYQKSKNLSALLLERGTNKVLAWGWEAELKYFQSKPTERKEFVYYSHFKPEVLKRGLNFRSKKVKDATGKEQMSIIQLYTLLLGEIKKTALHTAEEKRKLEMGTHYKEMDINKILFVLTVPALWEDEHTETLRECANECGMKHVEICYEPTAAAFAIVAHSLDSEIDATKKLKFEEGEQVVLLDMGGGTIDASCLEFKRGGLMGEVHHRDGLKIGGMMIDKAFEDMLGDIFGVELMENFREENSPAWLLQKKEFWQAKNNLQLDVPSWSVKIVAKFKTYLKEQFEDIEGIQRQIANYKIKGTTKQVELEGNYLILPKEAWMFLHEEVLNTTRDFLEGLLSLNLVKPKMIILTGGFSNCPYVIPKLEECWTKRGLLVHRPPNPHQSVVIGSVKWALNMKKLKWLRSPWTLGWRVDKFWYPGDPDDGHKVSSYESPTGYIRTNCFNCFIMREEEFESGQEYKDSYTIPRHVKSVEFELYKSHINDKRQVHQIYCNETSKCELLKKFTMYLENPLEDQADFDIFITMRNDRVVLQYNHPNRPSYRNYAQVQFEGDSPDKAIEIGAEFKDPETPLWVWLDDYNKMKSEREQAHKEIEKLCQELQANLSYMSLYTAELTFFISDIAYQVAFLQIIQKESILRPLEVLVRKLKQKKLFEAIPGLETQKRFENVISSYGAKMHELFSKGLTLEPSLTLIHREFTPSKIENSAHIDRAEKSKGTKLSYLLWSGVSTKDEVLSKSLGWYE